MFMHVRSKQYDYYQNKSIVALFRSKIREEGFVKTLLKSLSFGVDILVGKFIFLKPRKEFNYKGTRFSYFYHRYNKTWKNERAIEIPLFIDYLQRQQGTKILEVGNVLNHYGPFSHEVLDKYEKGRNIQNEDIVTFIPEKKYDCVVSVSTLEHVGIDDRPSKPERALVALKNIQKNYLTPKGKVFISFPINYNPALMNVAEKSQNSTIAAFRCVNRTKNIWKQVHFNTVKHLPYVSGYPPKAVVFMEICRRTKLPHE